jgi:nicotinate (nicotinamide) nucleotide adenylyltransferase
VQETRPHFAVFGGSFNPVHQGHLELIQGVLRRGDVDHVLAVPANRSPFKGEQRLLPAELRCAMLRAALRGMARVSVLDLEIRRPPPSYTVDTLEALATLVPRARLSLVLGADTFLGFAQWLRADRILARAGLIVFGREDGQGALPANPAQWTTALPEPWRDAARLAPDGTLRDEQGRLLVQRMTMPIPPISSTRIREAGLLEDVPPGAREVLRAYLATHSL